MDLQSDSRKRPLDSDGDDGMTKRSNQGQLGTKKSACLSIDLILNEVTLNEML